jgi:Zn finger protein HypA/HybF involved in hydrogenase expression
VSKKFQKNKEDFVCEHCGEDVKGNGYTNHCPKCLWSKHVDVNPGDREALCQGMMKPVRVEAEGGEHMLVNRCEKCGHEKRNRLSPKDNFDEAMKVAKAAADKVLDKGK